MPDASSTAGRSVSSTAGRSVSSTAGRSVSVGSPSALRLSNEGRVLDALLTLGAASQSDLARSTGLSRATVHSIVRGLRDTGRVDIAPGSNARETSVRLTETDGTYVVLDFGHREVHGWLVSLGERRYLERTEPLSAGNTAEQDVDCVERVVRDLEAEAGVEVGAIAGVGVSVHAPLDRAGCVSPSSIMPNWSGRKPADLISSRLGMDVLVENDANAAAWAEWSWGSGQGSSCFVYAKTSHGVGAGMVVGGAVFRGATGMAGEIGHIVVDARGPLCNCGNRGCLSAVASGSSLLSAFEALRGGPSDLHSLVTGALAGDLAATRVITEAGAHLGTALAHVTSILGPDRIAVGGELAQAGRLYLDAVSAVVSENTVRSISAQTQVVTGELSADLSLLGVLGLVLTREGHQLSQLPDWLGRGSVAGELVAP